MIKHVVYIAASLDLVAVITALVLNPGLNKADETNHEYCAELKNVEGTHYTVNVEVGTPAQNFDLVIDTGSSNVIVESCECRKSKFCEEDNKCFETERSDSLKLAQGTKGPETVVLMFGSGPIETVISTDVVRMGHKGITLENGLFLMVDQMLDFSGPFEGIMGLGLPKEFRHKQQSYVLHKTQGPANETKKSPMWSPHIDGLAGYNEEADMDEPYPVHISDNKSLANHTHARIVDVIHGKSIYESDFMRKAGINRFSMCFNDDWDGMTGTLRLGVPPSAETFKNVGAVHWALDFRGATAGNRRVSKFCKPESMGYDQKTPCGAILDSGTTYILGQEDQLIALYEDLCDNWSRCNRNYTAMQKRLETLDRETAESENVSKSNAFQNLLTDCDQWFNESTGLTELPPVHFHVASDNHEKTLTLQPWSFIVSRYEETSTPIYRDDNSNEEIVDYSKTGKMGWTCEAAFGIMDYPTPKNGPAWVLGMPLFYSYVVQYDISELPPKISFSQTPCGTCRRDDQQSNLTIHDTTPIGETKTRISSTKRPRKMKGKPRVPNIDFQKGF